MSGIRDSRKAGSLWGMRRGVGGVKKSIHHSWLAKGLGLLCWGFRRKRPALFKSGQWHFQQDNAPVHNSILVTHNVTKMSIKRIPQPPYNPVLAPCNFFFFPSLRCCRYETTEGMKVAERKVIDTHTQENFHGAFEKLLERYNKCIAARGDYFEEGVEFHVCTINKSAHTKKVAVWKNLYVRLYIKG